MQTTGNLGLKKPEGTDIVDIADLNGNMDILDNAVNGKVDKVTGKQLSTNDYTAAEKTKLAGIATGATNYTHPATHPPAIIAQDASNRFVTDTEKTAWNAKETPAGAQAKADVAVAAVKTDYIRQPGYAATSGTATAYSVVLAPAPTTTPDGFGITIVPHVTNGASPTLSVNGLAAAPLKDQKGVAYAAGKLIAGKPYMFRKVGTDFLIASGGGGEYGTATAADVIAGKTLGTDNGLVNGAIPDYSAFPKAGAGLSDYVKPKSARADGQGNLVFEPQTGFYKSGLNAPGFGAILASDSNFIPANYLQGKPMFGQDGAIVNRSVENNHSPSNAAEIWATGEVFLMPQAGYYTGVTWTKSAFPALIPGNVRAGVSIGSLVGTLQTIGLASVNVEKNYTTGTAILATIPVGVKYAMLSGDRFSISSVGYSTTFSLRVYMQDSAGNQLNLFNANVTGGDIFDQIASGFILNVPANTIKFPRQSYYQGGFSNGYDVNPDTGVFTKPFNLGGGFSIIATVNSNSDRSAVIMRGDLVWG